jgi:hypothetical protein
VHLNVKKYENLKHKYPEFVSLDQFRIVCKIAKRSARYLVQNGIVPAIDTGRKTWRYQIKIDDVITYLRRREQLGSLIPVGATTSRPVANPRKSFSQVVSQEQGREIVAYFEHIYADYPDVLTTADVGVMTGLHKKSIIRIVTEGHLKVLIKRPKSLIPKPYLWEFIASPRFISLWSNSEDFIRVLEGFEEWHKH